MKGMTISEYTKVIEFLQNNNSLQSYWADDKKENRHKRPRIKYVDSCYDSRSGTWWSVTFRSWGATNVNLRSNLTLYDLVRPDFDSLYDWCIAFLKGEWEATEEFFVKIK